MSQILLIFNFTALNSWFKDGEEDRAYCNKRGTLSTKPWCTMTYRSKWVGGVVVGRREIWDCRSCWSWDQVASIARPSYKPPSYMSHAPPVVFWSTHRDNHKKLEADLLIVYKRQMKRSGKWKLPPVRYRTEATRGSLELGESLVVCKYKYRGRIILEAREIWQWGASIIDGYN